MFLTLLELESVILAQNTGFDLILIIRKYLQDFGV
jgi:hypothetical protein